MRLIRDGEPRTATSTFTQLLSSVRAQLHLHSLDLAWTLLATIKQPAVSQVWDLRVSHHDDDHETTQCPPLAWCSTDRIFTSGQFKKKLTSFRSYPTVSRFGLAVRR